MKTEIRVREAKIEDVLVIIQFNIAMAKETEDLNLPLEKIVPGVHAIFDHPHLGFYLVAELDGCIAGSLMVTTEWSDWRNGIFWWIQSVYVKPEFRRRGVYRALYSDVKAKARKTPGICGFRLYVEKENSAAQTTYSRMGMAEAHYKMFEELLE
jgi:ribosomal protein S18 acetylase RimI-like enzyme